MGFLDGLLGHGSDLSPAEVNQQMAGILTEGEPVQVAFRILRDLIVFTDRRLILVDSRASPAGRSRT